MPAADVRTQPVANGAASIASRIVVAGGGGCGVSAGVSTPGGAGGVGNGPFGSNGFPGPPGFGVSTQGSGGGGGTQVAGGTAGAGDNPGGGGGGGGGGSNLVPAGATVLLNGSAAPGLAAQVIITTLDPPVISRAFAPAIVPLNGVTNLTITLTNNNPAGPLATLTGINFTDNFAAQGLVITTGGVTGAPICAGVITANAGTSVISLANGTLAPGTCQITVEVRATLGGTQVNTTGVVSAAESGPGGTANATLAVASTVPSIVKSFNPNAVIVQNTSVMTITLTNPNIIPMTGVAFTDNFAALGLVITSAVPSGTPLCAGTVTATTGTSLVSLAGGSIAANSSCQIVVTVRANSVGTQIDTTSTLTSNEFAPAPAATAQLLVSAAALPTNTPTPTSTPVIAIFIPPSDPSGVPARAAGHLQRHAQQHTHAGVRAAVAPVVANPAVMPVLRPPSTGDAGLLKATKLPSVW